MSLTVIICIAICWYLIGLISSLFICYIDGRITVYDLFTSFKMAFLGPIVTIALYFTSGSYDNVVLWERKKQ
jgi:hypothetical protein